MLIYLAIFLETDKMTVKALIVSSDIKKPQFYILFQRTQQWINMTVLWEIMLCILVDVHRRFGENCCLYHQGTLFQLPWWWRLPVTQVTWCHVPQNSHENLKPRNCSCSLTFLHRSFTFNSNKSSTLCNNFSVYYPDVCLQLNMFRAFSRPSSGAQQLQWQPLVLPSYRGDSRAVFVVGPAGPTTNTARLSPCTYPYCYSDSDARNM
jgi:hypothetical protein